MIEYKLIRMKRKTISVSVSDDLTVIVKAPRSVSKLFIDDFVIRNEAWIEKAKIRRAEKNKIFTDDEERIKLLTDKGREYLSARLSYYSNLTGFVPSSVGITRAKTRFGSCSGKNRLNFSCYLFAYQKEAIDYVILHELCHIKYKNHSAAFYEEISKYMPDYKERISLLKNPTIN